MLTAVEDIDSETPESDSGIRPLLLLSVAFTSLVGRSIPAASTDSATLTFALSLLGYDIGVISGAIIYIEDDLHLSSFQVRHWSRFNMSLTCWMNSG